MREIKFRAWNPKRGEMLFIKNIWVDFAKIGQQHIDGVLNLHILKLMQYTGLKDKNDKEIYEGDIIKTAEGNLQIYYDSEQGRYDLLYPCSLDGTEYFIVWRFGHATFDRYEVVGNIYENPELLEVAND